LRDRGTGVVSVAERRFSIFVTQAVQSRVEGGKQDARVEEQRRHEPGRVAFTCSAA
jgi:hypothetical protein